jgi:putative transposase
VLQFYRYQGRGRDVSYLTPPAQIRTCGIPAYGSCLKS